MTSIAAKQAADSINALITLSDSDQSSLLEVIEDYFTFPTSNTERDYDSDSSEDSDTCKSTLFLKN